jgi:hypothetical protein
MAISDQTGSVRFMTGGNSYVGHLAETADPAAIDVAAMTLDEYARRSGIRPDFVKIDAEGAEPRIFEGMSAVLAQCRPKMLVELHDEAGYSAFRALLHEYSYLSRRIDTASPMSDSPEWRPEAEYLAIPSEFA